MPRDLDVSFVAIDEIQLGADLERGHVFTDRMLNRRGRDETLVLGATTMRNMVEKLLPGANILSRPRLSTLHFAGEKKLTRLPRRSAIVAFSADEVYAIAELIRRQRGGAAVVLGSLSPRTRNAQVALYQSGDVDYLVATDAIGMGLNLDVDHVAFASDRKFDGYQFRKLNPAELATDRGPRRPRTCATGHSAPRDAVRRSSPISVQALESHTLRFRQGAAMAQQRARLLVASARLRLRSRRCRPNRALPAHRSPRISKCWSILRATRRCARWRTSSGRDRAAVGGLPGSRLSQDLACRACGDWSQTLYGFLIAGGYNSA